MKSKPATLSEAVDEVRGQVRKSTPAAVVEMIATQLLRAREAGARVAKEGTVVRDLRGSVIAHPGLAVEAAATKLAADLIQKWK